MSGELLGICNRLGINKPGSAPDLVRKSFALLQHENMLLIALGYDYWFNPVDQKALGLFSMMLPDKAREEFLPDLNIARQDIAAIRKLLSLPDLPMVTEISVYTGYPETGGVQTVNPGIGQRTTRGGILMGGAGNFNLCTQALDLVAKSFDDTGVTADLILKLSGAGAPLDGGRRALMVKCYKYLRTWWKDGDLTKIGLTDR